MTIARGIHADGDDLEAVLTVSKVTAANLGLKLWCEAGGDLTDLPGVNRKN